jgi:hypothetical protein
MPDQTEIAAFPMVGDVNLFLKGTPENGDEEVEAEVMIAGSPPPSYMRCSSRRLSSSECPTEAAYRRKGAAASALQLLFHYATSPDGPLHFSPTKLVARIGESNNASLRLFEKLSFSVTRRVAVFQEVEMRYEGNGSWTGGKSIVFD